MPLIKPRRLERKRHQHELCAAAPSRLLFSGRQELGPEPSMALRVFDPELARFTSAAPRVAANASHDTIVYPHEEPEQLSVRDPGNARVELVDPVL